MKKLLQEFKAFINKGSVMDLAVGMIIGSAFTAIVTALVQNTVMIVGTLTVLVETPIADYIRVIEFIRSRGVIVEELNDVL